MTFEEFKKEFARIGGRAGKGDCKRKDPAHYLLMAERSAAVRRAKAALRKAQVAA